MRGTVCAGQESVAAQRCRGLQYAVYRIDDSVRPPLHV